MEVKLVSVTTPMLGIEGMSAEDLIVYTARVSNPENQTNFETSERLLKYLIREKHWSPFEMADMTVEVKTSRAIAQQIIRHKSLSVQEHSQRYSSVEEIEALELRMQADKNRQSSIEVISDELKDVFEPRVEKLFKDSMDLYEEMLKSGISRESSRFILPLNVRTTLYLKGSVRSWIHYLGLRLHETTQKEHREVAMEIYKIFKEQFPVIGKMIKDET